MRPSADVAQAIVETKGRYCRFIDSRLWDVMDRNTLADFTFEFVDNGVCPSGTFPSFTSRDTWVAYFGEIFKTKQSMHLVGAPELEQISSEEVKAIFPVQFVIADKGTNPSPESRMTGGGHYHDVFKRVNGEWLLAAVKIDLTYFVLGQ